MDYDSWNEAKKKINGETVEPDRFPKEGEIWICILGKNIGFEQNGGVDDFSRPVLIIKKFNNHMFWAVPLSSKQKKFDFYYNFTDQNGFLVSVILAQIRLISIKRLKRKFSDMPDADLCEIKKRMRLFL